MVFDRGKKIILYPKSCLILKCFVLGIVTDRAAIHLRGRPGQTAQNYVPRGDWEAGSHTEESDSGWEVRIMAGDGRQVLPMSFLLSNTLLSHPDSFGAAA